MEGFWLRDHMGLYINQAPISWHVQIMVFMLDQSMSPLIPSNPHKYPKKLFYFFCNAHRQRLFKSWSRAIPMNPSRLMDSIIVLREWKHSKDRDLLVLYQRQSTVKLRFVFVFESSFSEVQLENSKQFDGLVRVSFFFFYKR